MHFLAHYRGSAGQDKRIQPPQQSQQLQEHSSQFTTGHPQQPVSGRVSGDLSYQEQHVTTPTYDEYQQSLPSITSLLGNVQPTEPQQGSPHRRALSKVQSSPNIRAQTRQPRSPFPGSGIRSRSQVFNPPTIANRRESTALVVPQSWRDEPQTHEQFFPQQPYPGETQAPQRPHQPQISPVRTSVQAPYISPQETPTAQGFEFPYYAPQEPAMTQVLNTPTPNPFYPPATPTYITPGTEMMPMQPQDPFNTGIPTIPSSGVTYVGDSRAMLHGRAVSMGTLRGPQGRMGVSPQEEDKRRRAASASARFRRRKKEQEEENLKEIARLEKKIEDLKKEYVSLFWGTLNLDVIIGAIWRFVRERVRRLLRQQIDRERTIL